MIFACGEKPAEDTGSTVGDNKETENAGAAEPPTEPPPTDPPEPTEPPTTEEPTEPYVADPSLSYWDQIQAELEHYGLAGGERIFKGDDEAALMKSLGTNNNKREELDLSGDDSVPFSAAYKVWTTKDMVNFWDANYSTNLWKDVPVEMDDLIVGVIWIKGRRLEESEQYLMDDPAQFYLAVKTPTDDWGTEGNMMPSGVQIAEDDWQKIFFCGEILNEESSSSNVSFNIYMGYGIQEFEIGGVVAYKFPWTAENANAVLNFVDY